MHKRIGSVCLALIALLAACEPEAESPGRESGGSVPKSPVAVRQALEAGIAATSVNASTSTPYDLSALGSSDWAHWGEQGFVHKAGANQISDAVPVGGGTCRIASQTTRHAAWSEGASTACASDDQSYYSCDGVTGQGWSFTVPASQTVRTLNVYWGGAPYEDTNVKLVAHLEDGSAPDLVVTKRNTASVNMYVTTITYSANSTTTLKVTLIKNDDASHVSVDLKAAWLSEARHDAMLTFEDLSHGASLSSYGGIGWNNASAAWKIWDGGPELTRAVYVDSTATSEFVTTFTLPAGQVLKSLKISGSGAPATVKFSSPGNPERVWSDIGVANRVKDLDWTLAAAVVTVKITCGSQWGASDLAFDDVVYGPAPAGGPGLAGGSLDASISTIHDLPTLGTGDWAHWGAQGFVHKAGVNQISDVTPIGSGTCTVAAQDTRHAAWSWGAPNEYAVDDRSYYACDGLVGQGWSFTAPASPTSRTLTVYWGGGPYDGTNVKLVAHLEDGSAPDFVVLKSNTPSVNMYLTTITYRASSATTLKLMVTKAESANPVSVDLKAAWLSETPYVADSDMTFEDRSDGDVLSSYGGVTWGGAGVAWKVWDGGPELTRNAYVDSTATSEVVTTLTLPAGQVLKSLRIANSGAAATLKLSSPGNPERVWSDIGTSYQLKDLGWTTPAPVVTVKVTCASQWGASDLAFDDLVYGPAPGRIGPSLVGDSVDASTSGTSYHLTAQGTSDWAHWGEQGFVRKAGANQISDVVPLGGGTRGVAYQSTRHATWLDGTPTGAKTDDPSYYSCNGVTGDGWSFTVPAGTDPRTLTVYWGGAPYDTRIKLVAHLDDGSAPDFVVRKSSSAASNAYVTTVTYSANATTTLRISLTKDDDQGGLSVDLKAAWLSGPWAPGQCPPPSSCAKGECPSCGDGQLAADEGCDPALTAYCDATCSIIQTPTACASNGDCAAGQTCGMGNGPQFGGASYENFCWPANRCPGDCGEVTSACGECGCQPSCAAAQCGQRTPDGCGGVCYESCGLGEAGCIDDRDCSGGAICTPQGTAKVCVEHPGYNVLLQGYLVPRVLPNGSACLEGPLCPDQPCPENCDGFCNVRGECLAAADAALPCPASCPGACDTSGRCYQAGAPAAPQTTHFPAPATAVGELKGAFATAEDGSARYSVPLSVPAGRGGLTPQLALAYSSAGGDGPVGLGWSLTGISAISVCERSAAEDLFLSSYAGPALCLDGEPLRPLSAASGTPYASLDDAPFYYRPRFDAGYVVEGTVSTWESGPGVAPALGRRLVPGDMFRVYTDDGRVLTFGGSSDYLFRGGQDPLMGPRDVRKWLLARVEDQYGNVIRFEYQKGAYHFTGTAAYDPATGYLSNPATKSVTREGLDSEVVIRRIAYNVDDGGANSEVTFHYNEDKLNFSDTDSTCDAQGHCERRPAVHFKYWRGGPLANLLMLDRIEVNTLGRLVRSYDLGYLTTEAGRVTLLKWLQECDYSASGTACLPPLGLEYGNVEPGNGNDVTEMRGTLVTRKSGQRPADPWQYRAPHTAVADVNGDGADDFLAFGDDGALWMASATDQLNFVKVVAETDFPTFFRFRKNEGNNESYNLPFDVESTDWNKDGLSDLVMWGLDESQFDDGENRVHRCIDKPSVICGRNEGGGRLSATVPLGVWVYLARVEDGQVRFAVERVLAESNPGGVSGMAAAAGLTKVRGVHLSASVFDPGAETHARINFHDYNRDGLLDVLYCSDGDQDRASLLVASGSHLGDRWLGSFDPSVREQLSETPAFLTYPLLGLDPGFCQRALAVETRSDRTDLWDPQTHKVLTEHGAPTVMEENAFGDLDLSKYDLQFAELNGDDLPDLLLHRRKDEQGVFEWWFNTGTGFFDGQGVGFVPGQVRSGAATDCAFRHFARAVIGDFNSDGLDDVVLPACGADDADRVDGLAIFYARRSTTGAVEFAPKSILLGLTPGGCPSAADWAPKESPFRAFAGDFDGDGDQDLRLLGQEWSNGVSGQGGDTCDRFPRESKCCIPEYDADGFQTGYECFMNADEFNNQGECREEEAEDYDRATWKYFVEHVENTTFNPNFRAWYLLSRVSSTPVADKAGTELTIHYATGAGAETWESSAAAGTCAGLPKTRIAGRSQQGQLVPAPAVASVPDRRVYQRTDGGTGCNVPGAAWCAARLTNSIVKGYSERVADGGSGWSSCTDVRLFYENARIDAWGGFSGFERVSRVVEVGGSIRSAQRDEYDLAPTPMNYQRAVGELVLAQTQSQRRMVVTPTVLYPFSSSPVRTTVSEFLGAGVERNVVTRRMPALMDSLGAAPSKITLANVDLPVVRVVDQALTGALWSAYWANWGQGGEVAQLQPTLGLRLVTAVEETQVIEANVPVTTSGAWTSYTPFGFPSERLAWSAASSRLNDLRSQIPELQAITDVGSSARLTMGAPEGWFAPNQGTNVLLFSAEALTPHVTAGTAPSWPARQAHVSLVQSSSTGRWAAPTGDGRQDARLEVVVNTYDASAGLRTRLRTTPGGSAVMSTLHRGRGGFVTGVDHESTIDCEPSCTKSWSIEPDALALYPKTTTNPQQQQTSFAFDYATGQPTSITSPDGVVERLTYDALGRLEAHGFSGITQFTTYARAAATPVTVSTSDGLGTLQVDALYGETESEFGGPGATQPQRTTTRWFDAAGRPVRSCATGIKGEQVCSETEYDLAGRPVRTARPHVEPNQASQGTVRVEYDSVDRVRRVLSPSPAGNGDRWVEYFHSSQGVREGQISSWMEGPYAHHARVVLQTSSEAYHASLVHGYDAAGRLVTSGQSSGGVPLAATRYRPGVSGDPTVVVGPEGDVLTIDYDALGRREAMFDPHSGAHSWRHDAFGRVRKEHDNGTTREFDYDNLDRLTVERVTVTNLGSTEETSWDWDISQEDRQLGVAPAPENAGKLVSVHRDDGFVQTNTYGGVLNQLDSTMLAVPRPQGSSVELLMGYTYDEQGRLHRVHYPGSLQRSQTLVYNAFGGLDKLSARFGDLQDRTVWELTTAFQGQLEQDVEVDEGLLKEHRSYHAGSSALTGVQSRWENTLVQSDTLAHDSLGRVVRRELLGTSSPHTFRYDLRGRLEKRLAGEGASATELESYTYSDGGALQTKNGATFDYVSGTGPSFPGAVKRIARGAETLDYGYLASYGLVEHIVGSSGGQAVDVNVAYDAHRRVQELANGDQTVSLAYAPDGDRISQSKTGTDSEFTAYFGKLYERVEDGSGDIRHVFRLVDASGRAVLEETVDEHPQPGGSSIVDPGQRQVLVRDYQESVVGRALAGQSVAARAYDSFGEPATALDDGALGFTGHRQLLADDEFGISLVDMGGRVYEPNSGQFLQPDPMLSGLDHPQGFNRRSYVLNDPINFIDPTGFQERNPNDDGNTSGGDVSTSGTDLKRLIRHVWKHNHEKREKRRFKREAKRNRDRAKDRFKKGPFAPPDHGSGPGSEAADQVPDSPGRGSPNVQSPQTKPTWAQFWDQGHWAKYFSSEDVLALEERLFLEGADYVSLPRLIEATRLSLGVECEGGTCEMPALPGPRIPGLGAAARGAPKLLKANNLEHLSTQAQRSVRSLEQRLIEHRGKLDAFRRNPDAFDNKGFLKNAPSPEVRQRIIDGRIRHLEGEISNFETQLRDLLNGGG